MKIFKVINNIVITLDQNNQEIILMDRELGFKQRPGNNIDENLKFMDSIVYTILLDEDNTIKEIINHSSKEVDHQEIAEVAQKILKQKNIESKHVGSFLLEDYAYSFLDGKVLILLDEKRTLPDIEKIKDSDFKNLAAFRIVKAQTRT